jgi:hypothetical protein
LPPVWVGLFATWKKTQQDLKEDCVIISLTMLEIQVHLGCYVGHVSTHQMSRNCSAAMDQSLFGIMGTPCASDKQQALQRWKHQWQKQ